MDFALICSWGSIFMWLISIFSRTQPKIGTNQALKGKIYGRPNIYRVNSLHDNIEPTFSSKRQWVPRRPPKFRIFGGGAVKKFSALTRRPRPGKTCTKSPSVGYMLHLAAFSTNKRCRRWFFVILVPCVKEVLDGVVNAVLHICSCIRRRVRCRNQPGLCPSVQPP